MANLPKSPVPSRQVTPALEQVDAVAAEAVWVKRAAHECEREFRRRAEIAPKAGVMVHLTTVDGARTTGTLAYDPDGNVVDRGAARRGGVRPRVLPRPEPPPGRRGLRAHVARGGPGDAAAARRRRAGGAAAGAPDSSRGLVITLVSYPDVASMAKKPITTSPAQARTARGPWPVSAP